MFRPSIFPALLAFAIGASAQNPPQPALPVPPGTQPAARPTLPAAPVAPAASGENTAQLQFPNADVNDVLNYYELITGRRLIKDNQVIGQVNLFVKGTLPKEEAQKIIEISLLMNGFTIVPVEGTDGKLWKVIGTGKNPRNFGIPILSEADELPDNEQVVTFLKKLQYADPTELAQVLGQAIPASPTLGQTITPLPKAGALLITENSVIIRGILRILREIDLPPAEVKSEFFSLQRADAKDVLEKLQDIIQPKGQTGTPTTPAAGVPRPNPIQQRLNAAITPEGVPLPGGNATVENLGNNTIEVNSGRVLSEDAVVVGKTILQADQRTNRIHIVTRPVNLKFFRKLIDQLDADTIFGEPVVRPLKFVSAGDIIAAMKQAISDPGGKEDGGAGGAAGARTGQGNRGNTGNNQNLLDNNRFGNNSGGFGGGGGGGTGGFSESLNAEERDVVPEAFTVGNTRIIADKRANAIIVIGNKDVQQKVFAFLDKIDVRSPQVTIHAVIGTLSLTDNEQFGVDYILRKGGDHGLVSGSTTTGGATTGNLVIDPAALTSPRGLSLATLLNQSKITQIASGGAVGLGGFFTAGNALDVIVQALNTTGRFHVTSNPSVFTSNNKKAVISSGTEIAVPTNITSSAVGVNANNGLSTNSSVQFKTVATQLEVLPLINSDSEVQLEIVQKIDELSGESDTISGNAIPRIATRVLKTNVNVPNGATIVLGGLRIARNTTSKSGIPYLSKIPVLGSLFRSTRNSKTRDELVILLRPTVSQTPRGVIDQRERQLEGFHLESDLEAALDPEGIRKHVPADETFRRAEPVLREDDALQSCATGARPVPRAEAVDPEGIRKHVPADESFRRAEPVLRKDAAKPAPKRAAKKK